MFKSIMKAIGIMTLGLIVILGLIIFVPAAIVAWPVLLVILIFGLPFIIIGVVVGKEKDKEDKK